MVRCAPVMARWRSPRRRGRPELEMLVLWPAAEPARRRSSRASSVGVVERLSSAARVLRGGVPDPVPCHESSREHAAAAAHEARPQRRARPTRGGQSAPDCRGGRSQQPAERATRDGQDDARAAAPLDPAAARALGGDRGDAHPQRHWQADAAASCSTERPFRAPHHSITTAGLIGGARRGWVGEVVLAHNGVLFLDELSEFARPDPRGAAPAAGGRAAWRSSRARHSAVYPARFMLLAATNPCPCGYAGEQERCRCSEADLARHRRRLSGPLLDRIDLLVSMERTASRPSRERVPRRALPAPASR